jgi:hypothetical protein
MARDDGDLLAALQVGDRVAERYRRGVVLHRAIRGEEEGDVIRALLFWQGLAEEMAAEIARLTASACAS